MGSLASDSEYLTFAARYRKHRPILDRALTSLRKRLEAGLRDLEKSQPSRRLFRIRLKEARVKECKELYDKIKEDSGLALERAFDPGHVRDLLGARLVCHNLDDVRHLEELFRKGALKDLNALLPSSGAKDWLDAGRPDTGYRALHFDVRWSVKRRSYHAEIQIRTLLQDAWANFMHDDVHKAKAQNFLTKDLIHQLRDMSDVLYALDRVFQGIRTRFENAAVYAGSPILKVEALGEAMFSMATFFPASARVAAYTSVSREDSYVISRKRPEFDFVFRGDVRGRAPFVFPISGDTPSSRCSRIRVFAERQHGVFRRLRGSEYSLEQGAAANVVTVRAGGRRRVRHNYRIRCVWEGVFERGREYVWAPLVHLYPEADVAYSLRLKFETAPQRAPCLYRIGDFGALKEIVDDYTRGGSGAISPEPKGDRVFEFDRGLGRDNYLCLFDMPER